MRAAHDATASLLFARAVFAWHETQVTGDLIGSLESTGGIEGRDKCGRRDRPDPGQRRQSVDHRISGDQRGECCVGGNELVIDDLDEASQGRERRFHRAGSSSAASRVRNVSVRPLRMRRPAARVIAAPTKSRACGLA